MKSCTEKSKPFPLKEPWARSVLYVLLIPLFPEYIAPVLAILSLAAAGRSALLENRPVTVGGVGKALLLYTAYQAISLPFAEMKLESAETLMLWVLMCFVYFSLTTVLTGQKRLDTALLVLSVVTGIVGLIGCLQYFLSLAGLDISLQLWEPVDRFVYSFFPMDINIDVPVQRVSSTFSNPNITSQYLVMAAPLVAHAALHHPRTACRRISRLCMITLIGCVAFTFSRGAYLALAVVTVVLIIANIRHIFSMAITACSVLLLIPNTVWERLLTVVEFDSSTLERLDAWSVCFNLIAERPLFGYGHGIQYTWSVMVANEVNAPHAHNLILQVLVEGGFVGLLLMLFVGLRITQSAFSLTARKADHHFGVTVIAFMAGLCTHGLVEYGFAFPKLAAIFFVAAAVVDVMCHLRAGQALSPITQLVTPAKTKARHAKKT